MVAVLVIEESQAQLDPGWNPARGGWSAGSVHAVGAESCACWAASCGSLLGRGHQTRRCLLIDEVLREVRIIGGPHAIR